MTDFGLEGYADERESAACAVTGMDDRDWESTELFVTCWDKGDRVTGEYVLTVFDLGFVDGEGSSKV